MLTALILLAQDKGEGPPFWATFAPLIVIFALFYFLIILPARRNEKKRTEELFSKLKKNDEVLTSAGIIGVISSIKDDEVVLKIDDNAKIRVLKSTLVKIMNAKDAAPAATDNAQNVKAGTPSK
jgi:preprotein translocase subunit YajC